MFFETKNLCVNYGKLEAVKDVSIKIPSGIITALLGANGAGKSTIFKTISGIIKPATGKILFENKRIDKKRTDDIIRLGISQVPEGKRIFRNLTVIQNLKIGAYSRKDGKQKISNDLDNIFDRFPVLKGKANNWAGSLSGGQQQLLVIARALMSKPKLLLMDEPAQGLAPLVIKEIAKEIKTLNEEGLTIIVIEHNVRLALNLADKLIILNNGRLIFEGTPDDFSEDEYTQKIYLGG
jgi:branched-chain amino acid transport system ATP-binding protein